jgi:hypothetical protein
MGEDVFWKGLELLSRERLLEALRDGELEFCGAGLSVSAEFYQLVVGLVQD